MDYILCSGKRIVLRLMQRIAEWELNDWLTMTVAFLGIASLLGLKAKQYSAIFETTFIICGLIGAALLFRVTKPYLEHLWKSALGKMLLGLASLFVITLARILADFQIVITTGSMAGLLPRAQDVLTLVFCVLLWFYVGIIVLGVLIIVSQFIIFGSSFLADTFGFRFANALGRRVWKALVSGVAVFVSIGFLIEKAQEIRFNLVEYAVIYSSFIPNMTGSSHLGPSPDAHQLCPSQPQDAWLAFVRVDAVLVALPASSDAAQRPFIYFWGQCGREGLR